MGLQFTLDQQQGKTLMRLLSFLSGPIQPVLPTPGKKILFT